MEPKTRRKNPGRSLVLGAGLGVDIFVEMVVFVVGSGGGKAGLLYEIVGLGAGGSNDPGMGGGGSKSVSPMLWKSFSWTLVASVLMLSGRDFRTCGACADFGGNGARDGPEFKDP